MDGIIAIDKPKGYTSFDIVAIVRKYIKQKKIGHTGTLDPMATGVLPILIGQATKVMPYMTDETKEYIAYFKLGLTSDTLDITGKLSDQKESNASFKDVLDVLEQFRGEIEQVPPMYSAVSKDGVKLYKLARQGIDVFRKPRKIIIHDIKLINFDEEKQSGEFFVHCSKGTYVRSLCADMGKSLGYGAVMSGLRRIKACSFSIDQCISLNNFKDLVENGLINEKIFPIDSVLTSYPKVCVTSKQARRFLNGGELSVERLSGIESLQDKMLVRVYSDTYDFISIGRLDMSSLVPVKNFKSF